MEIIKFLEYTEHFNEKNEIRPRLFCRDGFNMSVQWSNNHYCDHSTKYNTVEIGMPSEVEPLFLMYAEEPLDDPEDAVYGFVPVEEVKQEMCDYYCKYPTQVGSREDLFADDSPCMTCPLNKI